MKLFTVKSIAFATVLMLGITGPSYAETSPDARTSKMAQIFKRDMIGADLAYLQQFTGIARNTEGSRKIYKVEGCEVTATVKDGKVAALGIDVSPSCTFDLNEFWDGSIPQLPALNTLTIGKFDETGTGSFFADCLDGCGAANPVNVYAYWSGSRVTGWNEVLLKFTIDSDESIEASRKWEKTIPKVRDRFGLMDNVNCKRTYDTAANKAFKNVKITGITVGRSLDSLTPLQEFTAECK